MKFETGKIRKNSNKKIKALLEMATHIELVTQTMGLDDCFTMNEPETKSAQDVLDWLADDYNYKDAMVSLSCDDDGNPTLLRVEGPYHFCDIFKITFEPVTSDSELEEQEVAEVEEKTVIRAYTPEYYEWLNNETDPEPEGTRSRGRLPQQDRHVEQVVEAGQDLHVGRLLERGVVGHHLQHAPHGDVGRGGRALGAAGHARPRWPCPASGR